MGIENGFLRLGIVGQGRWEVKRFGLGVAWWLSGLGSSVGTAVVWIAAVAWVQSLAQELSHAKKTPPPNKKKKKKEKKKKRGLALIFSGGLGPSCPFKSRKDD